MKYLVLMADDDPESWIRATEAERQVVMDAHEAFSTAVQARATMLAGEALEGVETAVTLRPAASGAERMVTDGPYAETVEQLGGFYLVECADAEAVVEACEAMADVHVHLQVAPVLE